MTSRIQKKYNDRIKKRKDLAKKNLALRNFHLRSDMKEEAYALSQTKLHAQDIDGTTTFFTI